MDEFDDIDVRRFAIDKASTSLLVEYKTGKGKRFLRRIRFKRYKPNADPSRVAAKLMKQFTDILGKDKVNETQVLELVQLLLSKEPLMVSAATMLLPFLDCRRLIPVVIAKKRAVRRAKGPQKVARAMARLHGS